MRSHRYGPSRAGIFYRHRSGRDTGRTDTRVSGVGLLFLPSGYLTSSLSAHTQGDHPGQGHEIDHFDDDDSGKFPLKSPHINILARAIYLFSHRFSLLGHGLMVR